MTLRLGFYSDQELPANAEMDARVLQVIGRANPRIGYVASRPDPSRYWYDRKRTYYAALGASLFPYVDSETTPGDPSLAELLDCDAIHLSGGNTFTFLAWLRRSGLSKALCDYALSGGMLIGVSAGSILLTPSTATAHLCGDEPDPLLGDPDALGLVPFHFWPHYEPGCGKASTTDLAVLGLSSLYACPDGSGILVADDRLEFIGHVTAFALNQDSALRRGD